MARKESDLVKSDNWTVTGLISDSHVMSDWATKRDKGILTAELTESVRQRIGGSILGLPLEKGQFTTEGRKAIKDYMTSEANSDAVDTIRAELRTEAQAAFEDGSYGAGTRGPLSDPPRVAAILPFIVELNAAKGRTVNTSALTRNDKIEMVAKFETEYGGPRGKYRQRIADLTAGLVSVPSKSTELVADL